MDTQEFCLSDEVTKSVRLSSSPAFLAELPTSSNPIVENQGWDKHGIDGGGQ